MLNSSYDETREHLTLDCCLAAPQRTRLYRDFSHIRDRPAVRTGFLPTSTAPPVPVIRPDCQILGPGLVTTESTRLLGPQVGVIAVDTLDITADRS